MKTLALVLTLSSLYSVASADPQEYLEVTTLPPFVTGPGAQLGLPLERTPERQASHRMKIAGGTLLGVAAASFAASVALGLSSFGLDFCGFDTAGAGCDRTFRTADRLRGAAIGLGVVSGAALVVGIPLTVIGAKGERSHPWKLGAAPTEGGAVVTLGGRF